MNFPIAMSLYFLKGTCLFLNIIVDSKIYIILEFLYDSNKMRKLYLL